MLQAVMPIKDKLYRYAFQILGNRMSAEDVVQEVLIKVWKKKISLQEIENKEAWCMTVTRNLALDKLRKNGARHESIEQHYHLADHARSPHDVVQTKSVMAIIRGFINQLPNDQRQIVHLRDVEGYTYKEISKITGLNLDKVKVYLHRARITLRKQLIKMDL